MPVWEVAMNCSVQVVAGSEGDMASQNARPSEEPTLPQHRQCEEMLEETCMEEDALCPRDVCLDHCSLWTTHTRAGTR